MFTNEKAEVKTEAKRNKMSMAIGVLLTVAALFFVFLYYENWPDLSRKYRNEVPQRLNDHWKLIHADGTKEEIQLPASIPSGRNKEITIERTFSEPLAEGSTLAFQTEWQSVYGYYNGKLIYSNDNETTRPFGKATPGGWNFIDIPSGDINGNRITLTFSSPYERPSGECPTVILGNRSELTSFIRRSISAGCIICYALAVCGFILFVATRQLSRHFEDLNVLCCMTLFITLAAICLCAGIPVPQYYFINDFLRTNIGFLLAPICTLPFLQYMKLQSRKQWHPVWEGLFIINIVAFMVNLILQLTELADFYETAIIVFAIHLISATTAFIYYITELKNNRRGLLWIKSFCMLALTICVGMNIYEFYMPEMERSNLLRTFGMLMFVIVILTSTSWEIIAREEQRIELRESLEKIRIQMSTSQIKPHFLFNSLGAIRDICDTEPEQAVIAISALSEYLRTNIDFGSQEELVPFKTELAHIHNFMGLEHLRFGSELKFVENLEVEDFMVPLLSVQPLIENAVIHGVRKRLQGGTVCLSTRRENERIIIEVKDDGAGFEMEGKKFRSLSNIRLRICKLLKGTIKVSSVIGGGTKVELSICRVEENATERQPLFLKEQSVKTGVLQ